jgi:hypothetical protein
MAPSSDFILSMVLDADFPNGSHVGFMDAGFVSRASDSNSWLRHLSRLANGSIDCKGATRHETLCLAAGADRQSRNGAFQK